MDLSLDSVTYAKIIQSSTKSGYPMHGKLAHAHMIKSSFRPCLFLLNNLLNMYCKCRDLDTAQKLLYKMPKINIISYNSLISGYTQMGLFDKVTGLFHEARLAGFKLDKFTYAGVLSLCGQTRDFDLGKLLHTLIITSGWGSQIFLTNCLIDMYSKCGQVIHARHLFENSEKLDVASWNSLIAGYGRSGANEETLSLVVKMQQSGLSLTTYALGSVLKTCCNDFDDSRLFGRMLHGYITKVGFSSDIVVSTALLDMYAKTGNLDHAAQVFNVMPEQNVVTYNAMIVGLLEAEVISYEHTNKVFNLFREMQMEGMKPSKFTFSSILKACKVVEAFQYGKQIHAQIYKAGLQVDEFIASALIDLYSLFGLTANGLKCFNSTPKLDIVSWTSMLVGYIKNEQPESALTLFHELLAAGKKPDEFILSSLMGVCANLASARSGEQIQGYVIKTSYEKLAIIQNSQICMYAKSGDIDSANLTFKQMKSPDVVSWSAIICSNAQHGFAVEALELFESMKSCRVVPNAITFLGVLNACSHGGLVEEGLR